jgi:periplasmic protein TonB
VGWRRVLVAGALAMALHAAVLLPARLTLVGSALPDTAPTATMTVRLLSQQTPAAAVPVSEPAAALPAAPELVQPPVAARGSDARSSAVAAASPAASAVFAKPAHNAPDVVAPAAPTPAAPTLPPAPDYFAGGRLDPGPRPLEDVNPAYPEEAKQQEGSVVLRLLINEAGTVDNAAVVRAYPAGLFEESALEAFGKAKFSPGQMFGVAVKSQITIEVMFTPINRGKVSGRSY